MFLVQSVEYLLARAKIGTWTYNDQHLVLAHSVSDLGYNPPMLLVRPEYDLSMI